MTAELMNFGNPTPSRPYVLLYRYHREVFQVVKKSCGSAPEHNPWKVWKTYDDMTQLMSDLSRHHPSFEFSEGTHYEAD